MKMRKTLILLFMLLVSITVCAQQKEHTVAKGETLAKIAAQYGLTEEQLKLANPHMKMCYTGLKLVIPTEEELAAMAPPVDEAAEKIADPGEAPADTVKKSKMKLKKFFNKVGKGIAKGAKVAGAVTKAALVTKLKGGSYYDAISNAIDAADGKIDNENAYGLVKKKGGDTAESLTTESTEQDINDLLTTDGQPTEEEMTDMQKEYDDKYKKFDTELTKLRSTFDRANTVAKQRTWKKVAEAATDYRNQMTKIREECEMYTGYAITPSDNEKWRPIVPKQ